MKVSLTRNLTHLIHVIDFACFLVASQALSPRINLPTYAVILFIPMFSLLVVLYSLGRTKRFVTRSTLELCPRALASS